MLISLILAVLVAQAAPAAAPTPVPDQKPDMTQLMYFNGSWSCTSMLRGKVRPDNYSSQMAMNGQWIHTHDVSPPFDQYRTRPVNAETFYTYDPNVKKYVSVNYDDFGGYGIASTPGWSGNTMTWTDKSQLDGSTGQVAITKVSDSQYTWKATGTDGKGKAIPVSTGSCKKTSPT
jgi:hypothetical protein